jgi:hypothetical protein
MAKIYNFQYKVYMSWDSTVNMVTVWTAGVQLLVGAGDFSLLHIIKTGSWVHQTSYPMHTEVSLPGDKVTEA